MPARKETTHKAPPTRSPKGCAASSSVTPGDNLLIQNWPEGHVIFRQRSIVSPRFKIKENLTPLPKSHCHSIAE